MAFSVEKIDESAARIRSNQFFALPIYLYLVVAAASVTDENFLFADPVALPIIQVGAPLLGFFILAPLIVLSLQLHGLAHFLILRRRFGEARFERAELELEPFPLSIAAGQRPGPRVQLVRWYDAIVPRPLFLVEPFYFLLKSLALFSAVVAPVITLVALQWLFLKYQHEDVSILHSAIACVSVTIGTCMAVQLQHWALTRGLSIAVGTIVFLSAALLIVPIHGHRDDIASRLWVTGFGQKWESTTLCGKATNKFDPADEDAGTYAITSRHARTSALWFLDNWRRRYLLFQSRDFTDRLKADLNRPGVGALHARDRNFVMLTLVDVKLPNARMYRSNFRNAYFERSDLSGSWLTGAKFESACLSKTSFERTRTNRAVFEGADLEKAWFSGADLKKANFVNANLRKADFTAAQLREANFEGANLVKAVFPLAKLFCANFKDLKVPKRKTLNDLKLDFRGAVLTDALLDQSLGESMQWIENHELAKIPLRWRENCLPGVKSPCVARELNTEQEPEPERKEYVCKMRKLMHETSCANPRTTSNVTSYFTDGDDLDNFMQWAVMRDFTTHACPAPPGAAGGEEGPLPASFLNEGDLRERMILLRPKPWTKKWEHHLKKYACDPPDWTDDH